MSRRPARPLLVCLALGLAPLAAQEPARAFDPGSDDPLRAAHLGWDGVSPHEAPCPVAVELEHTGPTELRAELVLRSGAWTRVEPLTLPPGARRRVSLAIQVEDGQVLVQLREGGRTRSSLQLSVARALPGARCLLALDGRPPARRGGGDQRWNDSLLPLFSAGEEWAPAEAACYLEFPAVYLRGVDPDEWTPESRAALLEYVLQGGTLLLGPAEGVGTGPAETLLPGPAAESRPRGLGGRRGRERPLGLGRVLALEEDLLTIAAGSGPEALTVARALGQYVAGGDTPRAGTLLGDELEELLLAGPGLPTQGLLLGFVSLYVLVVGPGLALFGRRMRRRRLLGWILGLVGAFTLLAPLVAGLVRAAPGTAFVSLVQYVPPEGGPGVEVANVTVVSGGASRGELVLGAQGTPLSATLHPADPQRQRVWDGRTLRWEAPRTRAPRTVRGDEVRLDLAMAPWGRQSASTVTLLPAAPRVRARVEEGPQGLRAVLENLGPGDLGPALLMESGTPSGLEAGYVDLGPLPAGTRREVPLPRQALRPVDLRRARSWSDLLGLPPQFRGWGAIRPTRPEEVAPRYVLVSRAAPRLQVLGRRLSQVLGAVRIDPVLPPLDAARGYLGVLLSDANGSLVLSEVERGSPAAAAGLGAGDMIQTVDGSYVQTVAELRERLGRRLVGERVEVVVWSQARRAQRKTTVVLGPRTGLSGGD